MCIYIYVCIYIYTCIYIYIYIYERGAGLAMLKTRKRGGHSMRFLVTIFDFRSLSVCYVIIVCVCYVLTVAFVLIHYIDDSSINYLM